MRPVMTGALFLLGTVVGGFIVHWYSSREEEGPWRGPTVEKTSPRVTALGRIEPEGGVITLGIPIPDRLWEIKVKEEDSVEEGQPLGKLESYKVRKQELELIQKKLAEAKARFDSIKIKGETQIELDQLHLQQIQETRPIDIKLQKQKIDLLKIQAELARKNLKRLEALGSAVSTQELEQQRLQTDQAETELKVARETLEKLEKSKDLEIKGGSAQLVASKAALASALKEVPLATLENQVNLARIKRDEAIIHAPRKGIILKILSHPGELVGAQKPILQMADTRQMMVIAEVYETDIHKVRLKDKAVITGRALAKELTGTVIRIGAMVGKNRVMDIDPTADVDRRVVEVTIRLDQSSAAAKLINHQVRVEIDTGR